MHKYTLILIMVLSLIDQVGISQEPYAYTDIEKLISLEADSISNHLWNGTIKSKVELDPFINKIKTINSDFTNGVTASLLGIFYRNIGESDKAQKNVLQAENLLNSCCYYSKENAQNYSNYCGILANAGLVNMDTILFQKSIVKNQRAVDIGLIIKDTVRIIYGYDFMGDVNYYSAYKIENFEKALHYYNIIESLLEKYEHPKQEADNALGKANVYRQLKNVEKEKLYFDKAEKIATKHNLYSALYALYFDKAELYDISGEYRLSLKYKLKGYEHVLKSKNKEFINRADRQLWWTYKNLGNYNKALHHYELYQTSIAEMNKSEVLQLESELKYKEQILSKEKEITLLENESLRSNRNLLLLIAGLIGGLLLLSLWTNRRLKKNNEELEQKNREIILAQVTGQNLERKRMAGELHDNLNTKIAAIRWQLEAIQGTETLQKPEMLDNTINQLNDAYEDIRLISHNLMPETVQSIGLIQSIEDLIEKLNKSDKVNFHFITEELKEVKFDSLAYPVYNIIFEMVNNIMKHAQAGNAWISLSRNEKGDLKISVSDDGNGFDVDEMKGGYGIKNITSRVANLHGDHRIESAPGKGTKIYIEIPHL